MSGPDDDAQVARGAVEPGVPATDGLRRAVGWAIVIACVLVLVFPHLVGVPRSPRVSQPPRVEDPGDSAPVRQMSPAQVMLGTCILACVLAATGGPFLNRLATSLRSGGLRGAYVRAPPDDAPRVAYLEAFAIFLAGFIVLSFIVSTWSHGSLRDTWWCYGIVPIALATVFCRRGATWLAVRSAIGWHRGRGWAREIGAGLFGYAAGLPLLGAMFIVSAGLATIWGMPTHPALERVSSPSDRVTLYLLGCVAAPLVEETMFRGVLFHYLRAGHGAFAAALVSALLFAAIHPQGIVALPVLTGMALVLAGIREWRGSLIASVTAHAFNNAVVLTLAMSVRNPALA